MFPHETQPCERALGGPTPERWSAHCFMDAIARRLWAALRSLLRQVVPHRYHPRFVRRTHVVCPETNAPAEIDLELAVQPADRRVIRCSRHPDGTVPCDQPCLRDASIWQGPADALLILPPGHGVPDEQ